ncbi:3-oxoacyl-[acyl-carrier protein] reductase [Tumebacillus sp. BK434]|uniref:SDR family oxidoreductase n=1 Tax=Tumebacillus sp. BK434 TaxID=2512169 RepID=UPI00104D7D1A|nr:SDR family oxidoreductase [Tumebacillus sp. BK434]TCP54394.1 3-oxoacyl-[acyl-carrier protein] reductase [Tumebacillus sp. BK434]
MDVGLHKKVVLVMAASKGLGKAVAAEFAREGAQVMIAARSEASLLQAAAEIREATGGEIECCVADASNRADIDSLMERTIARFGGLDVLVTNAGGPPGGTFDDFEDEIWERAFQSNLLNVVRLIRAALPHLRKRGGGRILNITSTSIKQPIEGLILSNTFRAGIQGLAKTLAVELAVDNILINTIAPGRIDTDRVRELDAARAQAQGRTVEQVRNLHEQNIPLGRYGTPEEFAKVAVFLGSQANTYVTGSSLLIDGGMVRAL